MTGTVDVDGVTYVWSLKREPQWSTADGWKGMAVELHRLDGERRAVLEFPMPKRALNGSPQRQRPQINGTILANGVRAALEAGWEPVSRGKTMAFEVDANGC